MIHFLFCNSSCRTFKGDRVYQEYPYRSHRWYQVTTWRWNQCLVHSSRRTCAATREQLAAIGCRTWRWKWASKIWLHPSVGGYSHQKQRCSGETQLRTLRGVGASARRSSKSDPFDGKGSTRTENREISHRSEWVFLVFYIKELFSVKVYVVTNHPMLFLDLLIAVKLKFKLN